MRMKISKKEEGKVIPSREKRHWCRKKHGIGWETRGNLLAFFKCSWIAAVKGPGTQAGWREVGACDEP